MQQEKITEGLSLDRVQKYMPLAENFNHFDPRLLGGRANMTFAPNCVSASRLQLLGSHISQILGINGAGYRRMQTGIEHELAKYNQCVKVPETSKVLKIINKYPVSDYGNDNDFKLNPETLVFYEDLSGEIGVSVLKNYMSTHHSFGFELVKTKAGQTLSEGSVIPKDTVLMQSPRVGENGGLKLGREINIIFMSDPSVTEDGIVFNENVLEHFRYKQYEKRVVSFDRDKFPLNLYGDENNYRIFPEIGSDVFTKSGREGLLMCLRSYDESLLAIEQTNQALMTIDPVFDEPTYLPAGRGRVVDINIYHQPNSKGETNNDAMVEQAYKYYRATLAYNTKIVDFYLEQKAKRGKKLKLTPEAHRLILDAMGYTGKKGHNDYVPAKLNHRKVLLPEWRIEFTIEYEQKPSIGSKYTTLDGGKGVLTSIRKEEEMPITEYGLRADAIFYGEATVNRMIPVRTYEQVINGVKQYFEIMFKDRHGLPRDVSKKELDLFFKQDKSNQAYNQILNEVLQYTSIVSPRQYQFLLSLSPDKMYRYIIDGLADGFIDYLPSEDRNLPEIISQLRDLYPGVKDHVYWKDSKGRDVKSVDKFIIGSMYVVLLEKTGNDWTSVSTSKLQQNGVISYVQQKDRHQTPTKQQSVRFGESEFRIINSDISPVFAAELLDRSGNTNVRKNIVQQILQAENPSDIPNLVDRETYPLGYSQALQILNHLLQCKGMEMEYREYQYVETKGTNNYFVRLPEKPNHSN